MRVYLGSDHAGLELKRHLVSWLPEQGHQAIDCGPDRYDGEDDYPPYVLRAVVEMTRDPGAFAIVMGGSGNGEALTANKVRGVRAILAWNEETARLGRAHNDANVLSIGERMHDIDTATEFVRVFLTTPYSRDERHSRRIAMVHHYEDTGELPPL